MRAHDCSVETGGIMMPMNFKKSVNAFLTRRYMNSSRSPLYCRRAPDGAPVHVAGFANATSSTSVTPPLPPHENDGRN
jgi:hypothetical protein